MDPGAPVQYVKGIGPRRAAALASLGLRTVEDLLLRLPLRYEDRRAFARVADLRAGMRVSVSGTIAVAGLRRARRMSLFEARLDDGSGRLKVLWFNQPFLKDTLVRGARVVLYGGVEPDPYAPRQLLMSSPQWELVDEEGDGPSVHTARIVPVYEKVGPLHGKALRRVLATLAPAAASLPDAMPDDLRRRLGLIPRGEAIRRVHVPGDEDDVEALNAARSPGHRRLILEELFLFQLGLALRWKARRERPRRDAYVITDRTREAVKRILPFRLTGAQKRVLREIADDLTSPHPMSRLVQGDVGSGKTMVGLLAMVVALENGLQAAFMAPTEILAEQHYLTFQRLLRCCPYRAELFTASVKGALRAAAEERLGAGETQIAVGTHALLEDRVRFHRLGLVVIDEQHRFGVLQRDLLRRKGGEADVLVMTATPIPRTLALTTYGDLDVSVMDERPPGRTPVATLHRPASDRRAVLEAVKGAIGRGRQAYVVYPLVEESEKLDDVRAATSMAAEWARALPAARVALLHGRLKPAEKEAVMSAFHRGEADVLVSTTVIEVGVDVPNATLMVVEHAERFGLAQLHQLRGRVGRGTAASTCILVTHGRLSAEARARMEVLVRTEDGFLIAEQDLALRGPGDFFGTRQSGLPALRVANLVRDRDLMEDARREAFRLVQEGGVAAAAFRAFLEDGGWERRFGLARVG